MALTFTRNKAGVMGDLRYWEGTVTFDSSYPTGGEAYTLADFGLTSNALFVAVDNDDGLFVIHDRANLKLKVLAAVRKFTATHDAASLAATTSRDDVITVTGVVDGDFCIGWDMPAAATNGISLVNVRVSGNDSITARLMNATAGAVDLASGTYTFYVSKANGGGIEVASTTDLSGLVARVFVVGK